KDTRAHRYLLFALCIPIHHDVVFGLLGLLSLAYRRGFALLFGPLQQNGI
ncbi:unnamed protein product, partial [Amoebophrya sp. A120]